MTIPTDKQIDALIKVRNKITDVCMAEDVYPDTADIDALLSQVPAGHDNRVDLLLGRMCAKLPARAVYDIDSERARVEALRQRNANAPMPSDRIVAQAVTLELDPICAALLAQHNADVDQRKERGEGRRNGYTYMDRLEAAQREGKV